MLMLASLTIAALFGATRLTTDASNARLLLRSSEAYQVYQDFLTTSVVMKPSWWHSTILPNRC